MKYHIIVVGKTKDPHWAALETHYLERLAPFVDCTYQVIKPATQTGDFTEVQVKQKEAELIIAAVPSGYMMVACDEHGTQYTSTDFAAKLKKLHEVSGGRVCFVIGGTFGLDTSVISKADMVWSLSPLTFTHEEARVIMKEQLYRAHMIASGRAYHY